MKKIFSVGVSFISMVATLFFLFEAMILHQKIAWLFVVFSSILMIYSLITNQFQSYTSSIKTWMKK